MSFLQVLWDLDEHPQGNVQHIAEHGISKAEVLEVLDRPEASEASRSSGRPVAIGTTSAGRKILVVYDEIAEDTVYPVTAYDVGDDQNGPQDQGNRPGSSAHRGGSSQISADPRAGGRGVAGVAGSGEGSAARGMAHSKNIATPPILETPGFQGFTTEALSQVYWNGPYAKPGRFSRS